MKITLMAGVASLFALAAAGSASAADLPAAPMYKAPAAVAPAAASYEMWSGFYVGGHAGGAWSNIGYTVNQSIGSEAFNFDPSSYIGGGQIGFQKQWGPWVLGVEGSYSWLNLTQTDLATLAGVVGSQRTPAIDNIATATGRIGYAWSQFLLYGKGGWADVSVKTHTFTPSSGVSSDTSGWVGGYTLGVGLDYLVARNIVVGAEFDYYQVNFDRSTTFSNGTWQTLTNTSADVYAATIRVSYLFGVGSGR